MNYTININTISNEIEYYGNGKNMSTTFYIGIMLMEFCVIGMMMFTENIINNVSTYVNYFNDLFTIHDLNEYNCHNYNKHINYLNHYINHSEFMPKYDFTTYTLK